SSPHLDSRRAGAHELDLLRALAAPALQARTSDLEFAHAVLVLDAEPLQDAPILDLRLRKGVRRHRLRLAVASPHESALDGAASLRAADGAHAPAASARGQQAGPREVVVLWGERLTAGPNGAAAAMALLQIAERLAMAGTEGAGLLEVPAGSNGRGLREAGVLPNAGPGLALPAAVAGAPAREDGAGTAPLPASPR